MLFRILNLKRLFIVLQIAVGGIIILFLWTRSYPSKPSSNWSQIRPAEGYPDLYPCQYTNLRKVFHGQPRNKTPGGPKGCKPFISGEKDCQKTNTFFGSPRDPPEDRKCGGKEWSDICWFGNKDKDTETKLFCSSEVCKSNTMFMGKIDSSHGHVKDWTAINPFSTEKALEFVEKAKQQGDTFCFMKCGSVLQALVFPIQFYLKKTPTDSDKKINVNIIVMDSISRPHFYRMLKKSIGAFRDVINDKSIPATALDFELFQSIGTSTFENIRAMFSGFVVGNKAYGNKQINQPVIGINVMYDHFHKHGYQTVFEEDLCWYDKWGTLLSNIKITETSSPTPERWAKFKERISKQEIDHFGITFFSCEVLKQYQRTNPFGEPEKVCLNGRFYSSYFLRYIKEFSKAVRITKNAAPFISYMHINTGHSETGKRIRNIDGLLTDFIHTMAREPLTWTIFFGDHGHRRTPFALSTLSGDYERYNPLSFMIVPDGVAQILGQEKMEALQSNQKRLVTVMDLHRAIMSINDKDKRDSTDPKVVGVFGKISSNRSCSNVPLMPLVKCQCVGAEDKYEDNSPKHLWMAEFALGTLNNMIQQQYSDGPEGKNIKGYGNCKRYIGTSFRNIIQTKSGSLVRFDLHAKASDLNRDEEEIFKIAVAVEDGKGVFKSYERQSTYNVYRDCADASVFVKMCACDRNITRKDSSPARALSVEEMTSLVKHSMFECKSEIEYLYEKCLFQVTRNYFDVTTSVEVANACKDKTFKVRVTGDISNIFLTRSLPMNNIVPPNTIHFIYASTKQSVTHFRRIISIKAEVM